MRQQARYILLYVSLLPFRLVCRMLRVRFSVAISYPIKTDIEDGKP